ncbi:hypothetical protein QU481_13710 [Crenobacter sp. SG2303]|uniref:Uncharacterized protein n=1 Tax=Crenobacter oryzisoli TaxID=3056844 RepID=A0ABT7XQ63_9NEIS|nr:hypothetical protein [Crenobacter sp. SG2303]MDN0075943.1 hypothetical protein [Crenobacter sp. SG2303]
MKFVKPEIVKISAIFPAKGDVARLQQLQDLKAKDRRELNRVWSEVKLK